LLAAVGGGENQAAARAVTHPAEPEVFVVRRDRADVRDPDQARQLVATALDLFGGVDVVVSNAGGSPPAPAGVLVANPGGVPPDGIRLVGSAAGRYEDTRRNGLRRPPGGSPDNEPTA